MEKQNNISLGNAGEYFVAGILEMKGFTCAVPMSGTEDFDILAINRETRKHFSIQVKTTSHKKNEWTLSEKNEKEDFKKDDVFYVFVNLYNHEKENVLSDIQPEYHIVPGKIVAKEIAEEHQKWMNTPGRNGQDHNDNKMRKFRDEEDRYKNRWDLLN